MTSKKDNIKMQRVVNFTCDEKIADAIIKLHDKGYYTLFSCSGHLDEKNLHHIYHLNVLGLLDLLSLKTLMVNQKNGLMKYMDFIVECL